MNYLIVGQHKYNSAESWATHLVVYSDQKLTESDLKHRFYMHHVYKFTDEEDNTEKWTAEDHIEFFEENDGDAFVDYILQTDKSIPILEIENPLIE